MLVCRSHSDGATATSLLLLNSSVSSLLRPLKVLSPISVIALLFRNKCCSKNSPWKSLDAKPGMLFWPRFNRVASVDKSAGMAVSPLLEHSTSVV